MYGLVKSMKKSMRVTIVIFLGIMSGCVSMPVSIQEKHLSEKTGAEADALEKIEGGIITKKYEKDEADKDLLLAEQDLLQGKKKSGSLEKDETSLNDRMEGCEKTRDIQCRDTVQGLMKAKRSEIALQKKYIEFLEAKRDNKGAVLALKEAELAAGISELNYQKSLLAARYIET